MYVRIKKEVANVYEVAAKRSGLDARDLINDAAAFYIAYIEHAENEKKILSLLENIKINLESKEPPSDPEVISIKKSLADVKTGLSRFFFKEVMEKIEHVEKLIGD